MHTQPAAEMTSTRGVYCIRHVKSGKVYVGSAVSVKRRWEQHRNHLRAGTSHSEYLQRAWDKYGEDAFSFDVLECVENKADLIAREQMWIDALIVNGQWDGYNTCRTAGSRLGVKTSEETRAKVSAARTGKPLTPEHRAKISAAGLGRTHTPETRAKMSGKTHTSETRAKLRAASLGKTHTPETRAKISAGRTGQPLAPERLAKLIAANLGKTRGPHTPERRAKIGAANLGKTRTPETLAKMSAAHIGKPITPETRAKRIAANSARARLRAMEVSPTDAARVTSLAAEA
jgi:group I intron endonuclease